jgi:hypothetical protein
MWGGTDQAQSIATIRAAVERGVTLIDTAPAYGFGRSEEIVGKALAEGRLRDKVQLTSKIPAIGVSNYSPGQMGAFHAVARLDAVQPRYNLFEREIEADVLPYGWRIDAESRRDIDAILKRCITYPVPPEFMAPPLKWRGPVVLLGLLGSQPRAAEAMRAFLALLNCT